jgi:hypothetical protein
MPASSPTLPAGSEFSNCKSITADPQGPFSDQSVSFAGYEVGGSQEQLNGAYLIYRFQIKFDQTTKVNSVTVRGGGDYHSLGNQAVLRLLDKNQNPIAVLNTSGNDSGSCRNAYTLETGGVSGDTFFIDEYDYSTNERYRSRISMSFTPCQPLTLGAIEPGQPINNQKEIGWVFGVFVSPDSCTLKQQTIQEKVTVRSNSCGGRVKLKLGTGKIRSVHQGNHYVNYYEDTIAVGTGFPFTQSCQIKSRQNVSWEVNPSFLVPLRPTHQIVDKIVVDHGAITLQVCLGDTGSAPVCTDPQPYH